LPTDPIYVMKLSDDLASENFAAQILNDDNLTPASSKDDIKENMHFYLELDTDEGRVEKNSNLVFDSLKFQFVTNFKNIFID